MRFLGDESVGQSERGHRRDGRQVGRVRVRRDGRQVGGRVGGDESGRAGAALDHHSRARFPHLHHPDCDLDAVQEVRRRLGL